MLGQRLRRCPSIESALSYSLGFAGHSTADVICGTEAVRGRAGGQLCSAP